jgi:3-methyl-2-oxobutanoate hydroxymethyltransferase
MPESCPLRPRATGVYSICTGRILSRRSGTGDNMSVTNFPGGSNSASSGLPITKVTVPALAEMKRQGKPISALTAYDYSSSRLADEAGIDLLLVGDSLAMVVLGHENTLAVTVDEMLHHTRAVRRAVRRALVVADMPFGSYHGPIAEGLANAIRFMKEAGAEAVKIEGPRIELVRALTEAEIPVVGHLGLTPQSLHRMGGYRVQARTAEAAAKLKSDALALAEAGAAAIVLEGVPREVAAEITAELSIPTIGIGAGPECDGQILVFHDLLNLTFAPPAKFVRRYADAGSLIRSAIEHYREDVERHAFPSDEESYHLPNTASKSISASHNPVAVHPALTQ